MYELFLMNIYYDFFFNWQTEKKHLFWTNKKFFSFLTAQTEKKFVKQIGESIWWTKPVITTQIPGNVGKE